MSQDKQSQRSTDTWSDQWPDPLRVSFEMQAGIGEFGVDKTVRRDDGEDWYWRFCRVLLIILAFLVAIVLVIKTREENVAKESIVQSTVAEVAMTSRPEDWMSGMSAAWEAGMPAMWSTVSN